MAYHTCRVLAYSFFSIFGKKEVLHERNALITERDMYLEDLQGVSNLLLGIGETVETFGYFGTFSERVQSLVQEVKKKR